MVSFPARPADDPEPLKPDTPSRPQGHPQIEDLTSRLEAHGIRSTELVLDLVLHDLADEARQAVGATGAAIALEREGELVCRAAAGSSAPDLGVRIHTESGLSGICVKQGRTQICKDTECDDRVDAEACRRLGVRSTVIIPLFCAGQIIGILEVFSSRPNAYTTEDVTKLKALAESAAQTVQTARKKSSASAETKIIPSAEKASEPAPPLSVSSIMEKVHPVDPAVRVLRWLVIGLAIPLLVLIGFDAGWHRMRAPGPVRAPQGEQVTEPQSQAQAPAASIPSTPANPSPAKVMASKPSPRDDVSSRGGLIIYQNGKVVYREFASLSGRRGESLQGQSVAKNAATGEILSTKGQGSAPEQTSVSVAAGITGGRLLKSARPQYPTEAIVNKREGTVMLHGTVGPDGVMKDLKVVSGDSLLAQAAVEAVQQWQYEPYRRNGKPVNMPIDITIDFNLPK